MLFRNPVAWANRKAAIYGTAPYVFGVFIYTSFLLPYAAFSDSGQVVWAVTGLRFFGIILATLLLLETRWPTWLAGYFNLFYFFSVFYCIPLINAFILLNDPQGVFPILNMLLGILLLIVLVDLQTFILMQLLGFGLVLLANKLLARPSVVELGPYGTWLLFFTVVYILFLCCTFLRKKQALLYTSKSQLEEDTIRQTAHINDYLNLHQQLASPLHPQSSMMQVLAKASRELKETKTNPKEVAVLIDQAAKHFQQVANKSYEYLPIQPREVALADILNEVFYTLQAYGLEPNEWVSLQYSSYTPHIICDPAYIRELLTNAIKHLAERKPDDKIIFSIGAVPFDYELPEGSEDKVIQALRFVITNQDYVQVPQKSYKLGHQTDWIAFTGHPLIARNQQIMRAHYGIAKLKEDEEFSTQEYILPIDVTGLRPKIDLFSDEDLLHKTTLDDPQDLAFLQAVQQKLHLNREASEQVKLAMLTAKYYHRNRPRKSGEPYYIHPLAVATILLDYTQDKNVIIAAVLHDLLEDTPYTVAQAAAMFGSDVAALVEAVSHLHSTALRKIKLSDLDSLAHLGETENKRALLIKLADRLHNMRTIDSQPPAKRREIALETLGIFIPIAKELQLDTLAQELKAQGDKVAKL